MTIERPASQDSSHRPFSALTFVALGLAAGIGGTLLLRPAPKPAVQAAVAAPKKTMYQCPMHPQIIQDHPGDCPLCGMALVPMDGEAAAGGIEGQAAVTIDLQRQQLIGLRTAVVAEGPVGGELRTTARIAVDETRVRKVTLKVEGYVERLFVDFVGKPVAKGQPLLTLYSPEFVSAQQELLLALRTQKALAPGALSRSGVDLVEASRRRLRLWDVPQETLDRLEQTGEVQRSLTLRSPLSGVVTVKNVVEGARVTPADTPFEITDLGTVWAIADVYEQELAQVAPGNPAQLSLPALPGRVIQGRVAFVDPMLDPKTRTARVRLAFPNPKGDLRPELLGEAVIQGRSRKGLLAPLDAVLDAGTRKVVFLSRGEGRFEPREVTTGRTVGDQVEVTSGVEAGEAVVTGAAFLVDSESRLKAALARMGQSPAAPSAHGH